MRSLNIPHSGDIQSQWIGQESCVILREKQMTALQQRILAQRSPLRLDSGEGPIAEIRQPPLAAAELIDSRTADAQRPYKKDYWKLCIA